MSDTPLNINEELALANLLIQLKGPVDFTCTYRNYRGETACRRLRAVAFWHGVTEYHPDGGLMLKAIDLERGVERDFAVADFAPHTLKADPPPPLAPADACALSIADAMEACAKLPRGREAALVQTKLDEAQMWLQRYRPPVNEEGPAELGQS